SRESRRRDVAQRVTLRAHHRRSLGRERRRDDDRGGRAIGGLTRRRTGHMRAARTVASLAGRTEIDPRRVVTVAGRVVSLVLPGHVAAETVSVPDLYGVSSALVRIDDV